jgi:hypothetical protein
MSIPRIAVVATHDRPAELARCLRALGPQCDAIVVVDNASAPPVSDQEVHAEAIAYSCEPVATRVLHDDEQPPNLSRLWNVGLDEVATSLGGSAVFYDVAVINDDAIVPPGWWDAVSRAMRRYDTGAACSDPHGTLTSPHVAYAPDGDIMRRLCGWAFMLAGETGLQFDERLRWWFGDTDIDWRARLDFGGTVIIPGFPVENTLANTTTVGPLAEQAGRDRETFANIWGWAPW